MSDRLARAFPSLGLAVHTRALERGLNLEAIFREWMVQLVGEARVDEVIRSGVRSARPATREEERAECAA